MAIATSRDPRVERDTVEGYAALRLSAGELDAAFVPGLGMVGASLRHAGEELLDRRDGLDAYRETGAVMGLPLLHPWANRLAAGAYDLAGRRVRLAAGDRLVRRDEHGLPIHGLLAAHPGWVVEDAGAGGGGARMRARLDFGAHADLLAAFPFAHTIAIDVRLTAGALTVATIVRAQAPAVPVAFGFHPYLRLPGAPRERWDVSLPARRHVRLDARGIPAGRGRRRPATAFVLGGRGFDDGYEGIAPGGRFAVSAAGREIAVTHDRGYPVAQVYSPPGAPFICFEPMTAPVNALISGEGLRWASPTRPLSAVFTVSVRAR